MTIFYLMGWEELCVCSSVEKAQKEVFPNSKPLSKLDGRWIMLVVMLVKSPRSLDKRKEVTTGIELATRNHR